MILDLFAGVGVGLALRSMGLTEVGIDDDPDVATVRAKYRCILQDLPADLFAGLELTKTAQSRIVGNAVPASLVQAAVKAAT